MSKCIGAFLGAMHARYAGAEHSRPEEPRVPPDLRSGGAEVIEGSVWTRDNVNIGDPVRIGFGT